MKYKVYVIYFLMLFFLVAVLYRHRCIKKIAAAAHTSRKEYVDDDKGNIFTLLSLKNAV